MKFTFFAIIFLTTLFSCQRSHQNYVADCPTTTSTYELTYVGMRVKDESYSFKIKDNDGKIFLYQNIDNPSKVVVSRNDTLKNPIIVGEHYLDGKNTVIYPMYIYLPKDYNVEYIVN